MKSRRRIVFITTGLLTGGAEMMLWHLLTRLPRGEFEPIVVSLRAEGPMRSRFEQAGITVCSPEMNPAVPNPLAWWRLLRLVRALQPDILQGWMYHANVAASWCSRFLKDTRLFFSVHNSIYRLEDEKFLTGLIIKRGATLSARTAPPHNMKRWGTVRSARS
ncbi:MAG: glycosyltransferase [Deltaproteobacteria bacterium]|nr:glycosyltransferase [Deltaproteobacteria bacterium]